jgi:hypothetical protein
VTDLNTVAGAEDVIQNAAGAQSSGAELPFTGIDLWVVALAGLALLLAGFAGRRALTHRS